ncbi:hypothetical protein DFA_02283 [Cavenderia fasciculata]|uniref:Uncharacterized protein n=1 Tax=Cavenderia fasciculata TaxID=261658 RepID=F4PZ11_CACFS|nr:uncharacterized protein DFA_02283 [Cavenderia fasciculata]EGG19040.1 hypothetical protein DFA_02283 [Cavenderia fasciculata]|eukprot:XP_004366673.1 hypothetical protein DFA_02283 [Cavenderia fasciculata]
MNFKRDRNEYEKPDIKRTEESNAYPNQMKIDGDDQHQNDKEDNSNNDNIITRTPLKSKKKDNIDDDDDHNLLVVDQTIILTIRPFDVNLENTMTLMYKSSLKAFSNKNISNHQSDDRSNPNNIPKDHYENARTNQCNICSHRDLVVGCSSCTHDHCIECAHQCDDCRDVFCSLCCVTKYDKIDNIDYCIDCHFKRKQQSKENNK